MLRSMFSVKLALTISLAALMAASNVAAQTSSVAIPNPAENPEIKDVVARLLQDPAVKEEMQKMRVANMEKQAVATPLRAQIGAVVGGVVSGKVRTVQMKAMLQAKNPDAMPEQVAPKFQ